MIDHDQLRCLTIRQPWAWAVLFGDPKKDVENRTGPAWARLAGERIGIHAGKTWAVDGEREVRDIGGNVLRKDDPVITLGAVLGTVLIGDPHAARRGCCDSPWAHPRRPVAPGGPLLDTWHLPLIDQRVWAGPLWCRGQLGVWRLAEEYAFPTPSVR